MTQDAQIVAAKAAALLGERIAQLRQPGWQPLPHQVPPTGDWRGWAMIAGRMAGKTDACAHFIAEHVKGPPCLPGPVPHWIGIIAPTLGDAATSCFAGPSGLRVHSPGARMVQRPGGLAVIWPNGSEAKLFGAHTPEDVERLRSGGNRCISGDTLIKTDKGDVPVREVRAGDRVWTRYGLRRVLWSGMTRPNAETLTIRTRDGHCLELTPDHRVWVVGRGWVEAQNVTPSSMMVAWNHQLQGLRHGTTGAQSAGVETARVITRTTPEICCTGSCGKRVSDLSGTTSCCTTRTTTRQTTISGTSSRSPAQSTAPNTLRSRNIRTGSGCRPVTGAGSEPKNSGTSEHPVMWSAIGAGSFSSPRGCGQSSAEEPAVRGVAVLSVERNSTRTDTYDLTVEHDHEFFASDLIVHNCAVWLEELAAWRYLDAAWAHMRFGLRVGPHPRWVASTTPKPRPLIKRLVEGNVSGSILTKASYLDNPYIPADVKEALEEEYGGTQLGRQELYGELVEQDENALWTRPMIDASRIKEIDRVKLARVTVGVDPSGGAGEQGIVVGGRMMLPRSLEDKRLLVHGFVLADRTVHLSPSQWGRRAVQAAVDYEANDIAVEINYGGAMAISTIRSAADDMGIPIPIREVRATRGKRVRAEPVAALTEQGRWHHVGTFPELETQMTTWYPELDWSPDRLDGSVWTAWHNKVVRLPAGIAGQGLGSVANRQIG